MFLILLGIRPSNYGSIIVSRNDPNFMEVPLNYLETKDTCELEEIVEGGIEKLQEMSSNLTLNHHNNMTTIANNCSSNWSTESPTTIATYESQFIKRLMKGDLPPLGYCVLCCNDQHGTEECPQPPPVKFRRIRELNLCGKCLSPNHHVNQCMVIDIHCHTCGMEHLDYIYHKPENWFLKQQKFQ